MKPSLILMTTCASLLLLMGDAQSQVINACAQNRNGAIRLVSEPSQCTRKETSVSWNAQGPAGEEGPPGPQGEPGLTSLLKFVGFSAATTTGNAGGMIGINSLCRDSFGDGARICLYEEVLKTPVYTPAEGEAWILWDMAIWDYCKSWTADSATVRFKLIGQTMSLVETGVTCDRSLHVACCK